MNTSLRWVSLRSAPEALDMAPTALRRTVERRARLAEDGGIEASFDGIRARPLAFVRIASPRAACGRRPPGAPSLVQPSTTRGESDDT